MIGMIGVSGQTRINQTRTLPDQRPNSKPTRNFSPGIRIDWKRQAVEVDATVNLRRGPLELFACSPRTREHESILVIQARPVHIFQALGLVGLEPGSPARYDEQADRWLPPRGDRLAIDVRWELPARTKHTIPIANWLTDVNSSKSVESIQWVFSGGRSLPNGQFATDLEGTILCVVDFDSALISVDALHTAENEHLWLVANTKAIPPIGTPCTLVIRAFDPKPQKKNDPPAERPRTKP